MKHLTVNITGLATRSDASAATLMNSAEDLVARARSGDDDAFRLFFERYARPVTSFIYDMTGERHAAEELAQETFVRAYKSLGSFRGAGKASTWLFGIAKNVAREAIRARHRDNHHVSIDDQAVINLRGAQLTPDACFLNKELDRVIHDALRTLDEDKRLVFTLKVFQQWSYEEIAEVTGMSIPKVKTDLHRARIEMRRLMRPYMGVMK